MNIRIANKFDMPYLIDMVKHFHESINLPDTIGQPLDFEYINKIFHHAILGGGLVLVAEIEKPIGFLFALKSPNIWHPKQISLQELILWVEPEHRKFKLGHSLMEKFSEIAKDMITEKKIISATMSNTKNISTINYEKFGFSKLEETWVLGA
jgi:GNAT superfamily N-acetyltransferase